MSYDIIQAGELQAMVQDWQQRALSSIDDGYRIAVKECIHEIKELLNKTEEERAKEMEEEYNAYFNSLTPEEQKRLSEYLQEQEAESVFLLAGEA